MRSFLALVFLLICVSLIQAQNDVHIAPNADVGIGTDTPSDKIHVFESSSPYIRMSNNATGLSQGLRMGLNGLGDAWLYTMGAKNMFIGTGSVSRVYINSDGNVGIGTALTYTKLTMNGPIGFKTTAGPMMYIYQSGFVNNDKGLIVHSPGAPDWGMFYDDAVDNIFLKGGALSRKVWFDLYAGNISVEYRNPYNDMILSGTSGTDMAILRIGHTNNGSYSNNVNTGALIFDEKIDGHASNAQEFCGVALRMNGASNDLEFHGGCSVNFTNSTLIMAMDRLGSVGIGVTPTSTYKLQVAGKVRAEEVVVETGWADDVFDPEYELISLKDVELFIESNQHLPGVPSGQLVEAEGLHVGAMSSVFMRKIEELTLYTINQEREIARQSESLSRLVENNSDLMSQLTSQGDQIDELLRLTQVLSKEIEEVIAGIVSE
jgi:hypothetical protein